MKKLLALAIPALLAFTSCQKDSVNYAPPAGNNGQTTTPPVTNTEGYIVVSCANCKIDYGMPDQFRGINVKGTSPRSVFTYKSGYTLNANLYALDEEQEIAYTIYDTKGDVVYTNKATQGIEGYWTANILLP